MQSPKGDLHSSLKQEFSKIFYDNHLDSLANGNHNSFLAFLNLILSIASDIGFINVTEPDAQSSSGMKRENHGVPEGENFTSRSNNKARVYV